MAVGPAGVFAFRGAGGVEEARLHEQHERTGGVFALRDRVLRGGDLVERAADVHGGGAGDLRGAGDRAVGAQSSLKTPGP